MAQNINTKSPKDFESTSVLGNIITWANGGELKKMSASDVQSFVDARVSANADPKTEYRIFGDGDDFFETDNVIYTANELINTFEISPNGLNKTFVVSFDTSANGAVTITLPASYNFSETPTFGNNEHWEVAIRNGYVVWTKYDLA